MFRYNNRATKDNPLTIPTYSTSQCDRLLGETHVQRTDGKDKRYSGNAEGDPLKKPHNPRNGHETSHIKNIASILVARTIYKSVGFKRIQSIVGYVFIGSAFATPGSIWQLPRHMRGLPIIVQLL